MKEIEKRRTTERIKKKTPKAYKNDYDDDDRSQHKNLYSAI